MAQTPIQTFGKYQILERIATGGTAEIYKAKLEGIGGFQRTFAIKRILPNLSQNSDYIGMLVDEAKVAGLLSHANIVQILDLGQVDDVWFIAMEYVEGRDLGAVLRRARQKGLCLPVPHAVFVAIELLKGLEYAHQRQVMRGGKAIPLNIIHRDISPPNILMSYQGEVKLTDFGIARASMKMMETVSGIVKGRFDYMSPEQAEGRKDLDQRSDLFSVGVVLYEMLTGEHPFRAESELATVERVRTGKYTAVSTRNPEVPFALQTIVDRALRVDRDERYASATAFKEALDKFFHDAGFIFTHANLASYLKGLFPESQPRKRPQEPRTPTRRDKLGYATQATEISAAFDDPDGPTATLSGATPDGRADEQTLIRPNPLFAAQSMPPDDFANDQEQPTVIRRAPIGFDEEAHTVVRASPLADLDASMSTSTAFGAATPAPAKRSDMTATGVTASRRTGGYRRKRALIGWLGVALSIVTLVLGLVIGALLGVSGAFLVGGPTQSAAAPRVKVIGPKNTSVRVDGDSVPTEFSVAAGRPATLEIRVQKDVVHEESLLLRGGESRVIVVAVPNADGEGE